MKNLIPVLLFIVGLSSCSKDTFDPGPSEFQSIKKSEIMVTVSAITYNSGQCGNGCGSGQESISYVYNAKVTIFPGQVAETDQVVTPILQDRTDTNGRFLARDLDPGQYTVRVQSSYGIKSRVLNTQLNRRSSIEFSF